MAIESTSRSGKRRRPRSRRPVAEVGVEPNWSRRLAIVSGVALLVWLGWEIIGNTIADTNARTDPETALQWRPDQADALVELAQRQLVDGGEEIDLPAIGSLAKDALRANPLDEAAIRILALGAERQGNSDDADAFMSLASDRSLRDVGADLWLFNRRASQGKFAEALRYADAVLRTRPDLLRQLTPPLIALAGDASAQQTLINLLATAPPWRTPFLTAMSHSVPLTPATYDILAALETGTHPLQADELQPYVSELVGRGEFEPAFLAWQHFLPADQSQQLPYLFNGDFELPVSGMPFDWIIASILGASTEVADTGDREHGQALRVVFTGRRVPYAQVSKLVVLPPGTYDLTGLVKADDLVNERGMVWRIYCADGDKQTLATSQPASGTSGWRDFSVGFEVPATGCRAQWLRLELAARIRSEQQVSGAIWYDHLAITRIDPPTSQQQ